MADYGKLAVQSLEWGDRALLKVLFGQRQQASVSGINETWAKTWERASVDTVDSVPVLDYLIDGCMMRPRYLVRLFETARRRAITFGRTRINQEDYQVTLRELGWQVLEHLDRGSPISSTTEPTSCSRSSRRDRT